jgi:hypothetical protein
MFRRPKKSATSPARDALLVADRELDAARERHATIEAEAERLRSVADGEDAATAALERAVVSDGGIAALAKFAAGEAIDPAGPLGAAEAAARAASIARRVLPQMAHRRGVAAARVTELEIARRERLVDALISEIGEPLGRQIMAAHRQLAELVDQAFGLSQVLAEHGRDDFARAAPEFQIPTFDVSPLNSGPEFRGYLHHRGDVEITRSAARFREIASRLAADPARAELHKGEK